MLCCILLVIFRPHPQPINNINQKYIDSITILKQEQLQSDSLITYYRSEVENLDNNISKLSQIQYKDRIIYKDRILPVAEYTPTQLDSFFKQRYNE